MFCICKSCKCFLYVNVYVTEWVYINFLIWILLELGLDGMDFDGVVQIFILSFSWQPNKDWKRTEKWFCLGLRMGAWNLWFIYLLWCFYAEFSGFMNFICCRFRRWLKDEKIWVWIVILYIWVLWFEKIWDLLLGLCWCSCWRSICVCVWLTRKGKKMHVNLGMCSYV